CSPPKSMSVPVSGGRGRPPLRPVPRLLAQTPPFSRRWHNKFHFHNKPINSQRTIKILGTEAAASPRHQGTSSSRTPEIFAGQSQLVGGAGVPLAPHHLERV